VAPGLRLTRPAASTGPWLLLCAALALGALGAAAAPGTLLDWQPGRALAQPWRWFTAAWVHLDGAHLAANLAGAAVLALFGHAARCSARDALAWLCAWPLTHGLLLAAPQLQHYAGASGVLHAGVAVAATSLLARGHGRRRAVGALVLAGLLLKLLDEQSLGEPVRLLPGWDFPVVVLAHATGAAAGLACAAVAWATSPPRQAPTIGP
jgi:rhomboid family GlyGly-CTERM serine protease